MVSTCSHYAERKDQSSYGYKAEIRRSPFEAWDEEDFMIMAWLWNSMIPKISDTCMFLATAKDIWDAIQQTYSKARDAAEVYEVKVKTVAAKQGDKTVTEYANQLKSLRQ